MTAAMMIAPLIDVFSKLAASTVNAELVTAVRFLVQFLCVLPFVLRKKSSLSVNWHSCLWNATRAALTTAGMISFVMALQLMDIATAVAVFFVQPILLTILSAIILREAVSLRMAASCSVGLLGALIVIRPNFIEIGYSAALPAITALCVALSAVITRARAAKEDPFSMQLQMSFWGVVISTVAVAGWSSGPELAGFMFNGWTSLWLISVGVSAAVTGLLVTHAYRVAPASTLAPLQYLEIITAVIFGWIAFSEIPDLIAGLGIAVIIMAGVGCVLARSNNT